MAQTTAAELWFARSVLFNTLAYLKFFAAVFCVYWLLQPYQRVKTLLLLGVSYYFYAAWNVRYLPLIWLSSSVDFYLAHHIAQTEDPRARRRWLVVTVILNLGLLGLFKYFNLGWETAQTLGAWFGFQIPPLVLGLALPVGISFFTFESMSYVIDVYRRKLTPHTSYFEYLTFVAFFPHLVAGPIVRPHDLLPQLARRTPWDSERASQALLRIGTGLFKKVAIGDFLSVNLVDRIFDAPSFYSSLECYVAAVAYSLQIYADFSGYSDIAIGSAQLLGITFPENFRAPYQAKNIAEFWHRWHISLSTWLRDYLYIPLGGNRLGGPRTYLNLLITMLLGGLWHGANWTFVIWGGLHGAALALTRFWQERRGSTRRPSLLGNVVAQLLTFHFVTLAWVFFRSKSFSQARIFLSQLTELTHFSANLAPSVLLVIALACLLHSLPEAWEHKLEGFFTHLPAPAQALVLFALAWAVRQMATLDAVPFVYFQF